MYSLLIVGTLPKTAGFGGVAVHVERLLSYLNKEGVEYTFSDYKKESFFSVLWKLSRAQVVHLHLSNAYIRLIFILWARIFHTTTIVTFHGNYKHIRNSWVKLAFKLADYPITINSDSFSTAIAINPKTRLYPAFIPPQAQSILSDEIIEILDSAKKKFGKVYSTNAYRYAIDADGNEIYGIPFLCDYFEKADDGCLIVSDPSGEYKKRILDKCERVIFIDVPHDYFEILKRVDVFVRNTSTDGDSLSVREALYIGIPALCSDCVERPDGCTLFHYNDLHSFATACKTLKNEASKPHKMLDATHYLSELYGDLFK